MTEECKLHSGVMSDVKSLKDSDIMQWKAIERLQNRLPIWATAIISLLSAVTASALTYANLVTKASGS